MKKNKNLMIIIGLLILAIGFFVWGALTRSGAPLVTWEGTNVACLPGGHQNIAHHIHATLAITEDGESVDIPADIGINQTCMAEVHTHDTSGELHVETTEAERIDQITLEDFFTVWDRDIEKEGFTLTAYLDGNVHQDPSSLTLKDGQQIELVYESDEAASTSTQATTTERATSTDEVRS